MIFHTNNAEEQVSVPSGWDRRSPWSRSWGSWRDWWRARGRRWRRWPSGCRRVALGRRPRKRSPLATTSPQESCNRRTRPPRRRISRGLEQDQVQQVINNGQIWSASLSCEPWRSQLFHVFKQKYYNLFVPKSENDKNVLRNKEEESNEFQE